MEAGFLIAGLGNPGSKYARTRHNAGFLAVERIYERWSDGTWSYEKRLDCRLAQGRIGDSRVLLCQPQTYMNSSGTSVAAVRNYYRFDLEKLLVLVDDADLPLGQVRLRGQGSAGGHHGLESVARHLGSSEYARLRVGIGRRKEDQREITDWVLGRFTPEELPLLDRVLDHVTGQVQCWIRDGLGQAMNRFNGLVTTTTEDN